MGKGTRVKFNSRTLDSLKEPGTYWNSDPKRYDMVMVVRPTGKKPVYVNMTPPGKRHDQFVKLGDYPKTSLAELNAGYDAKLNTPGDGRPPHILEAFWDPEKRAPLLDKIIAAQLAYEKQVVSLGAGMLFEVAAADYIEKYVLRKLRPSYQKRVINTLRELAPWKGRLLSSITELEVDSFITGLHDSGDGGVGSTRLLMHIKGFFSWCFERHYITVSPAALVKPKADEQKRDRRLTDTEIRCILAGCDLLRAGDSEDMRKLADCVELLLRLGQRKSEISGLLWMEIDWNERVIRLPAERTKSKRAHTIPLTESALAILERQSRSGPAVFWRRGEPSRGWTRARKVLDAAILEATGGMLPAWVLHDLRSACGSGLARLRVDLFVISELLNHSRRNVTEQRYIRHDFVDEMRDGLQRWDAHLQRIADPASNVVAFSRGV